MGEWPPALGLHDFGLTRSGGSLVLVSRSDSLLAEANRALKFQARLLNSEVVAEIEKALESGGFSWPPEED
jgi:hypothetical protein